MYFLEEVNLLILIIKRRIILIIDYQVKSLEKFFSQFNHIKSINFIKCNRNGKQHE